MCERNNSKERAAGIHLNVLRKDKNCTKKWNLYNVAVLLNKVRIWQFVRSSYADIDSHPASDSSGSLGWCFIKTLTTHFHLIGCRRLTLVSLLDCDRVRFISQEVEGVHYFRSRAVCQNLFFCVMWRDAANKTDLTEEVWVFWPRTDINGLPEKVMGGFFRNIVCAFMSTKAVC